jgi:hypothetical protein
VSGNSPKFTRQIFLWLAQVNADRELPVSAVKFAIALASRFNEEEGGAAWPGIEEIGKDMGRSKPVVIEGREHLVAGGHIRFQPGSRGSGHSGRYWMILKGNPGLHFTDQEKVTPPYISETEKGNQDLPFADQKKGRASRTEKVGRPERKCSPGLHESSTKPSRESPIDRPLDDLLEKLIKAADGNVVHGESGIEVVGPILDLQAEGCDLDADILPAIRDRVPRLGEPLRTWGARFLRDAILARKASRLRARGGNGSDATAKPESAEPEEVKWRRMFDFWKRTETWPIVWGPPPNSLHGCEIPKELIAKWTAEKAAEENAE